MPNHCYNRVNVYSDEPKVIKEIHDIFETGTNPYVDKTVFGQIIQNITIEIKHKFALCIVLRSSPLFQMIQSNESDGPTWAEFRLG